MSTAISDQLRASLNLPPDALDFFGAVSDAAAELRQVARNASFAYGDHRRLGAADLKRARLAASRVLEAIVAYEKTSPIAKAMAAAGPVVADYWSRSVKVGAAMLRRNPARIALVLSLPSVWPPPVPLTDLLQVAHGRIEGERTRGREGHWTYDQHRLLAFEQCEAALLAMIVEGDA